MKDHFSPHGFPSTGGQSLGEERRESARASAVCSAGVQAGVPWTSYLESVPESHRVNITLFFYIAIADLPLYLVQCL